MSTRAVPRPVRILRDPSTGHHLEESGEIPEFPAVGKKPAVKMVNLDKALKLPVESLHVALGWSQTLTLQTAVSLWFAVFCRRIPSRREEGKWVLVPSTTGLFLRRAAIIAGKSLPVFTAETVSSHLKDEENLFPIPDDQGVEDRWGAAIPRSTFEELLAGCEAHRTPLASAVGVAMRLLLSVTLRKGEKGRGIPSSTWSELARTAAEKEVPPAVIVAERLESHFAIA